MTDDELWTLDELVERVTDALAGAEYPGAPNGRVRDVPDRRAVRWYATIGLVDRPAATRGRTALYGPRHLLQLVAVKRRQAQGYSLADIQAELAGATDAVLCRIAEVAPVAGGVPAPVAAVAAPVAAEAPAPARPRFWTDRPAAAAATDAPGPLAMPDPALAGTAQAPAFAPPDGVPLTGLALTGVPLRGGAVLLLPGRPGPDDLTAIHAAARPLLDLLADRGLLPPSAQRSPR